MSTENIEKEKVPEGQSDEEGGSKQPEQKKAVTPAVAEFDGIEIYCDKVIPQYSNNGNKAYKTAVNSRSGETMFAVVCEKHLLPRRGKATATYGALVNTSLASLITHGSVYWPPARQERYVYIYKDNLGKPLLEAGQPLCMGLKQEYVMERVVHSLMDVLQDFRNRDFFHGSIRPDNIFDGRSSEASEKVILGECLSSPPSSGQPSLYETIERAMADPIARGVGRPSDDLYSLGVTLAVMLRTQDPLAGLSEEEVIREKIRHGSYAAITGKDRFKGSILELLRGLLHDDPVQRWNVDEILAWMDGRRLSPKQSVKRKKASRPFSFAGEKFSQAPILAMALENMPSEAAKVVEDGSLLQWVERSLEDDLVLGRVLTAIDSASSGGKGPGYEERLVGYLSIAMDNFAPLRFHKLRMMGDGIGTALYEVMVLKQDVRPFIDLFSYGLAMSWINSCENPNLDVGALVGRFDSCKNFLRHKKVGYGLERCLYLLAPQAACLSHKFDNYCVTSPEDMALAFEDMCEKGDEPVSFMDRHTVAFLSVQDSKSIDGFLFDLNSNEEYKKLMGNLRTLAAVQKRHKLPPLPHIANVFLKAMPCVLDRFHDRDVRKEVLGDLQKFAKAGDLTKMLGVLSNPHVLEKDFYDFRAAMVEYGELRKEYSNLEKQLQNEKTFGRTTGKDIAALASGCIAFIIILVTSLMVMSGNSNF